MGFFLDALELFLQIFCGFYRMGVLKGVVLCYMKGSVNLYLNENRTKPTFDLMLNRSNNAVL